MAVDKSLLVGAGGTRIGGKSITQATWKTVTSAVAYEASKLIGFAEGVHFETATDDCQKATVELFEALIKFEKAWNNKYGTDYH